MIPVEETEEIVATRTIDKVVRSLDTIKVIEFENSEEVQHLASKVRVRLTPPYQSDQNCAALRCRTRRLGGLRHCPSQDP